MAVAVRGFGIESLHKFPLFLGVEIVLTLYYDDLVPPYSCLGPVHVIDCDLSVTDADGQNQKTHWIYCSDQSQ